MTRMRPASGVAVVEENDIVYLAHLPDGPIVVLEGVAALIWIEACAGDRESLVARVTPSLAAPPGDVASEVGAFVQELVASGLLTTDED